jgi:hypothetical protein
MFPTKDYVKLNAPIGRWLIMKLGTNKELDYIVDVHHRELGNNECTVREIAIILKLFTSRKLVANIEYVPY